jgi:hypothetical protein
VAGDTTWLTLPEVAERLGLPLSRVRELVRDRYLLAIPRDGDGVKQVPESFLVEGQSGMEVVPTLRGTFFVLSDAGLEDDEVMRWMLSDNDELGDTPIGALRAGRKALVRRVAQASF